MASYHILSSGKEPKLRYLFFSSAEGAQLHQLVLSGMKEPKYERKARKTEGRKNAKFLLSLIELIKGATVDMRFNAFSASHEN